MKSVNPFLILSIMLTLASTAKAATLECGISVSDSISRTSFSTYSPLYGSRTQAPVSLSQQNDLVVPTSSGASEANLKASTIRFKSYSAATLSGQLDSNGILTMVFQIGDGPAIKTSRSAISGRLAVPTPSLGVHIQDSVEQSQDGATYSAICVLN